MITPAVEFMVAIDVFDDDQLPPVCVEENVVVNPTHTFWVPDKVPATGAAVTVRSLVAVAFGQPPVPVTVYVIVAVPAATPVITPVFEFMVAIDVFDDDQLPPVCVEEKVVVNPTHTFWLPDTVPAFGAVVTVTETAVLALSHPLVV